jgi:hypothetical protein
MGYFNAFFTTQVHGVINETPCDDSTVKRVLKESRDSDPARHAAWLDDNDPGHVEH